MENIESNNIKTNKNWCLMKFKSNFTNISFAVIHKDNLRADLSYAKALMTKNRHSIEKLYESDDKFTASKILQSLESKIFEKIKVRPWTKEQLDNTWLLIQYKTSATNVSYEIVHHNDTILYDMHEHGKIVTYFRREENLYQAKILKRTYNQKEIIKSFDDIQEIDCPTSFKMKKSYIMSELYKDVENIDFDMIANVQRFAEHYYHHDGRVVEFTRKALKEPTPGRMNLFSNDKIHNPEVYRRNLVDNALARKLLSLKRAVLRAECIDTLTQLFQRVNRG